MYIIVLNVEDSFCGVIRKTKSSSRITQLEEIVDGNVHNHSLRLILRDRVCTFY
jgi:hypothetical protein